MKRMHGFGRNSLVILIGATGLGALPNVTSTAIHTVSQCNYVVKNCSAFTAQ